MERDSGSWSFSDYGTWYCFDKWMGELTQDKIPEDYEEEVDDPRRCGRFRYCHALLDRLNNPDSFKLCKLFCENLFEQSPKFTPWEHEIHKGFEVDRDWEIFNYIESMCREERNKNVNKFLIVVKFGVFTKIDDYGYGYGYRDYYDDDSEIDEDNEEEIGFVQSNKSSIEGLEKVSGLGRGFECPICLEKGKKSIISQLLCCCLGLK